MIIPLDRICELIGAEHPAGASQVGISGVASLEDAREGHLSFLSNNRYLKHLATTGASAVIVRKGIETPPNIIPLSVDDPYFALVQVLSVFNPRTREDVAQGIDPLASVSPDASIGSNVSIGPFSVIGKEAAIGDGSTIGACTVVLARASIGKNCLLYPNVTIMDRCVIGDRVIIHAGAVIGADGFGFAPHGRGLHKIPQIGIVRIGDDVEIGACTCIDRAAFGETFIAQGTKLDNLIQIAHNVKIGMSTVMAAMTGIAGSAEIGSGVKIGGQSGIAGHIQVGDGSSLAAGAGVTKDVPAGATVSGYPAIDHMQDLRLEAALRHLPELLKTVKLQEERIQELERIIRQQEDTHAG